jgi:hypothetical protein
MTSPSLCFATEAERHCGRRAVKAPLEGSRASCLPAGSFLIFLIGLLAVVSSCAIHPPHYSGEMRSLTASKPQRPEWTQWGVRFKDGQAFVTGVASQRESVEKARQAAEEDARRRLAASIQTTLQSEFQGKVNTQLRTVGEEGAEGQVEAVTQDRILAVANATLSGTTPQDEYVERYEVFGKGWETRCDCWLLLSVPEAEYRRQLDAAFGAAPR